MPDDPNLVGLYKKSSSYTPYNLTISFNSPNQALLSWGADGSPYSYNIYMAKDDTLDFQKIGTTASTTFTVNRLESDRNYYFCVSSQFYDSIDFSGPIPVVTDDPIPSGLVPPSVIKTSSVTTQSGYGVRVSWDVPSGIPVLGYRVWRGSSLDAGLQSIGSTPSLFYIDSGLDTNYSYYYRITSLS